jgi:hypothetical protein
MFYESQDVRRDDQNRGDKKIGPHVQKLDARKLHRHASNLVCHDVQKSRGQEDPNFVPDTFKNRMPKSFISMPRTLLAPMSKIRNLKLHHHVPNNRQN